MPDTLEDLKLDIRAQVETAVFTTEVNRRDSPLFITEEYHIVPSTSPYRIRLDEVPDRDSGLGLPEFTEVLSMPTQAGTFYVDWVMGYIWFHPSDRGRVVNPRYFGKGSLIDATDINNITRELTLARQVTHRLRPSVQDVPNRSIRIDRGSFFIGNKEVSFLGNNNIRLGPGGEFETSALPQNNFNKLLFTISDDGRLKRYEGTPGATTSLATAPGIPSGEMPVCVVTVQDDGSSGPGTIKVITQRDIKDLRVFLQVPAAEHRYLSIYHEGVPVEGEIFFDGFYFSESVTIDRLSLHARSAPRGSSLQIDLMRNGSVTGRVATLAQDTQGQTTTLSQPISFDPSDKLGLKVIATDSQGQTEGIAVMVRYL